MDLEREINRRDQELNRQREENQRIRDEARDRGLGASKKRQTVIARETGPRWQTSCAQFRTLSVAAKRRLNQPNGIAAKMW